MATKKMVLTSDGKNNLEKELNVLKSEARPNVALKLKEARLQGDLSENAEYDSAKEEQATIENRILEIENILKNSEIVNILDLDKNKIRFGSKLKLLDLELDEEIKFMIVGSAESSPLDGKISNESPLGKSLIGKRKGEIVEISAPSGNLKYKIISIL
ncbi:MAG: transcription elongation factor GreA [Clostridiales bacterium]|nr:transcription elongation factor GreA [Clostridiales bacterium]